MIKKKKEVVKRHIKNGAGVGDEKCIAMPCCLSIVIFLNLKTINK